MLDKRISLLHSVNGPGLGGKSLLTIKVGDRLLRGVHCITVTGARTALFAPQAEIDVRSMAATGLH